MPPTWYPALWEVVLVLITLLVALFLATLPSQHSHFEPVYFTGEHFTAQDRSVAAQSGYECYVKNKDEKGRLRIDVTVAVVVLGDIGRSPRMQYHALSIASHGGKVTLVGYVDSEVHPDVQSNRFIDVVPLRAFPRKLQTNNKLLFLFLAPLKVLWQLGTLYYTLGYRTTASKWMLVQNPPSIPTLAVAQFLCFFRLTKLVIDWHNFGYSILALRLGTDHAVVKLSQWYEKVCSRAASAHFAVTDAMVSVLGEKWDIQALTLHDRPPKYFQPLSAEHRFAFLRRLKDTTDFGKGIEQKTTRLVVSPTSWTPDEDFSILLDALVDYSAAVDQDSTLPLILAIITGKGPQKELYLSRIHELNRHGKLANIVVKTAWLTPEEYALLLASADLGISLHTSSSGVDLPMKVVDMFGSGLPVAGWSKFQAWPELVQEGLNGRGFDSADGLVTILKDLFGGDGQCLEILRQGALQESSRRWEDEWMPIAGRLFELKP